MLHKYFPCIRTYPVHIKLNVVSVVNKKTIGQDMPLVCSEDTNPVEQIFCIIYSMKSWDARVSSTLGVLIYATKVAYLMRQKDQSANFERGNKRISLDIIIPLDNW